MQLRATPSRLAVQGGRRKVRMSIYSSVISKYAQDLSTQTVTPGSQTDSQTMDPSQLQPGQPVYSQEGKEYMVLSNPAGESQKILMPSDQQGSGIPTGVTTVDDSELSTEYSLTSPDTEQKVSRKRSEVHMNLPGGYARSISTGSSSPAKELQGLKVGQDGYVEVMNSIKDMVEAGRYVR